LKKIWSDTSWDDYLYWQKENKKLLKKINDLIKDIERTPFKGLGKPEPLRNNLSGWWSRRLMIRIVLYTALRTEISK